MKAAHHRGNYHTQSKLVTRTAKATPHALCWRCGQTLQGHAPHANGKPPHWTAGHTIDGSTTYQPWLDVTIIPPPGDWLAPESSTCNYSAGPRPTNPTRIVTTRTW